MQNYMFYLTYEKLHILNKKATRILWRGTFSSTKITRNTVLSLAYDVMYSLFMTLKWSMLKRGY